MWRQKINAQIDYPLEGLDLNRYISGPRVRRNYDLFAISVSDSLKHMILYSDVIQVGQV